METADRDGGRRSRNCRHIFAISFPPPHTQTLVRRRTLFIRVLFISFVVLPKTETFNGLDVEWAGRRVRQADVLSVRGTSQHGKWATSVSGCFDAAPAPEQFLRVFERFFFIFYQFFWLFFRRLNVFGLDNGVFSYGEGSVRPFADYWHDRRGLFGTISGCFQYAGV